MSKAFHYGITVIARCKGVNIQPLIKEWLDIYRHLVKHKGRTYAVKFCKELNTVAERYALYQPIVPLPFVKSTKDGFPKLLNKFKPYLRDPDPTTVMLTLSVFRTIEEQRLPISKDLGTITDPPSWKSETVNSVIEFIPKFVEALPPIQIRKMDWHLTMKNGPNGPALQTSDLDTHAVTMDKPIRAAIAQVELALKCTDRMNIVGRGPEKDQPIIHSKLQQFPEKSGKTRTIAIIDYYSQRCLKPIHDGLMGLLRKMESDGTHSHNNVGMFAKQKTYEKSYIFCADMTAFTDRFPREIQEALLRELLKNDDLAAGVWTLLAERTFTVAWSNEKIQYATGQPMGAYASWPLCTLAHHLLVEYSAYKTGTKRIRSNYRIIGDDIIICEEVTAQFYRELVSHLGITINMGKTVESHPNRFVGAEVAKQLYLNGTCLTPLTPGFVRDMCKPYMFNACLGILMTRYDYWEQSTWPMLIDNLFRKEKVKKLVWLLTSDPISGNIKPGNPGYDISSPWIQVDPVKAYEHYTGSVYMRITDLAEEWLTNIIDYHHFRVGPLADRARSQKPSFAAKRVLKRTEKRLQALIGGDMYCTSPQELEQLASEYFEIPDPNYPFMRKSEIRQRRLSSLKESIFQSLLT